MVLTSNLKVKYLVDENIKKSGSDFTSAISDLGGGDMGRGCINLWNDGECVGKVKGIIGTTIVVGVCILIQKGIHKYRVKQILKEMSAEHKFCDKTISSVDNVDIQETDTLEEQVV